MMNSAQIPTPTRLLANFSPVLKSRAIFKFAPAAGTEDEIASLRAELIALSLEKVRTAGLFDAVSLSELGSLQPVVLSRAMQRKLDRLMPDSRHKTHFSSDISSALHRHHWRVELRVSGSYFKGLKRLPRHVLLVSPLTQEGREKIAESKKRIQFPQYGHAARLLDDLNVLREFFDGDANAFVDTRLWLLGPLSAVPAEDEAGLIAWAEGIKEIQREFNRRDFLPL